MSPNATKHNTSAHHSSGALHTLVKAFRKHGLAVGILILLGLTLYYAIDLPKQDWPELWSALALGWPLAIAALAINMLGLSFDFLSWICAWRAQGVRFTKKQAMPFFLSVFALQLTPMQLGRFVRVAFAFQAGIAPLRAGATAEFMLLVMDVVSLGAVFAAFLLPATWLPASLAIILFAGPTALWFADRLRWLVASRLRKFSNAPFLSWWNLGAYYGRAVDWLSVSTILYLMGHLSGVDVSWHAAGVSALGASLIASASALPGGLGVSETALSMGLNISTETAMKLSTGAAVLGFRILTFWLWLPFGWWGLIRVKRIASQAQAEREAHTEPTSHETAPDA